MEYEYVRRVNAVFEKHNLPIIPHGTNEYMPILTENIEKLAAQIPPEWATYHMAELPGPTGSSKPIRLMEPIVRKPK